MYTVYHKNRLVNKLCRTFYIVCVGVLDILNNTTKFLNCSKMKLKERILDTFHILLFLDACVLGGLIRFWHWLNSSTRNKAL